jgi:hypothetical protein
VAAGLTRFQEIVLKRKLRKACPSEPWVEAQIKIAADKDRWGQPIRYRYHDVHVFPPGGEQTKMIRCPVCGVFNPPNAGPAEATKERGGVDAGGYGEFEGGNRRILQR